MTTSEQLKAMTDSARFERLASSVIRRCYPELCRLIDAGVNEKGETIKGALDGFTQIGDNEFAYVEYTIDDTNLRNKWLYDVNKDYKGKRPKEKATVKDGDLVKAAQIAAKQKSKLNAKAVFTVYLVTNQRVDKTLWEKVMTKASELGVKAVVVENSNMVDYLDNAPDGQWIRFKFFETPTERISKSLLMELCWKNFEDYIFENFATAEDVQIREESNELETIVALSNKPLIALVGESGMGKSFLCLKFQQQRLDSSEIIMRIEPSLITQANSLEELAFTQLKRYNPNLYCLKEDFYSAVDSQKKIVLIVDDINKASNSKSAFEHLIVLCHKKSKADDKSELTETNDWAVICPVWPATFDSVTLKEGKNTSYNHYRLGLYSSVGAMNILRQRINRDSGLNLTLIEAQEIADYLNHDPLLIGLYIDSVNSSGQLQKVSEVHTVDQFLDHQICEIASVRHHSIPRIWNALIQLGCDILRKKELSPTFDELNEWYSNQPEVLSLLESICSYKGIMQLLDSRLTFRHDRVRDRILEKSIKVIAEKDGFNNQVFEEPYFAEIIGRMLSERPFSRDFVVELLELNPLSTFVYFKIASKNKELAAILKDWLKLSLEAKNIPDSMLWNIGYQLQNTESDLITSLTSDLPDYDYGRLVARFKNGDGLEGIKFLVRLKFFPPEVRHAQRDEIFDHAKSKHYERIEHEVENLIRGKKLNPQFIKYVIGFCGLWKSNILVRACFDEWKSMDNKASIIYELLWAIIITFDETTVHILTQSLEIWESIKSEEPDNYNLPTGTKEIGIDQFSRFNWDNLNEYQIEQLGNLYNSGGRDSKRLILQVFSKLDHPIALQHVIDRSAHNKRNSHPDNYAILSTFSRETWLPPRGKQLSPMGLAFLSVIWNNSENGKEERVIALEHWCNSSPLETVISRLRRVTKKDSIYETAIWRRLLAGDTTVIESWLKTRGVDHWSLRNLTHVWCAQALSKVDKFFTSSTLKKHHEDNAPIGILFRIPTEDAEYLIVKHWGKLNNSNAAILAALYVSTEKTRQLASSALVSTSIEERFRFINQRFGFFETGMVERMNLSRLESLKPYFPQLGEELRWIAEYCSRSGLVEWSKDHISPHLNPEDRKEFFPTVDELAKELADMSSDRNWVVRIKDWCERLNTRDSDTNCFKQALEQFSANSTNLFGFLMLGRAIELKGNRTYLKILELYDLEIREGYVKEALLNDLKFSIMRNTLK